jgi:Ca2+-binding EF-hand superfamily protein
LKLLLTLFHRIRSRGPYISFEEATQILKRELNFPEERAIYFVKRFDHNKDGRLSAAEFSQFKSKITET